MFTIGTPLPTGATVHDKLEAWITQKEDAADQIPQPVGHMKMVPLSDILRYTFRQEEMRSPEHARLLKDLKAHIDKPYCQSLMKRG